MSRDNVFYVANCDDDDKKTIILTGNNHHPEYGTRLYDRHGEEVGRWLAENATNRFLEGLCEGFNDFAYEQEDLYKYRHNRIALTK